jgi:hypothetical protein
MRRIEGLGDLRHRCERARENALKKSTHAQVFDFRQMNTR